MRKHCVDAYRNMGDLKLKVLADWEYNNLLITCYDTALLWLMDLYTNPQSGMYPKVEEVNVMSLVNALANRSAFLKSSLEGYDRLYFSYELVYRNYIQATDVDVSEAIRTLCHITDWWCKECSWKSLSDLAIHVFPDKRDYIKSLNQQEEDRKQLFEMLSMKGTLENTLQLVEVYNEQRAAS